MQQVRNIDLQIREYYSEGEIILNERDITRVVIENIPSCPATVCYEDEVLVTGTVRSISSQSISPWMTVKLPKVSENPFPFFDSITYPTINPYSFASFSALTRIKEHFRTYSIILKSTDLLLTAMFDSPSLSQESIVKSASVSASHPEQSFLKKLVAKLSKNFKIERKILLEQFLIAPPIQNFGPRFVDLCLGIDNKLKKYGTVNKTISLYEDHEIPNLTGIEISISIPSLTVNDSIELTNQLVKQIAEKAKDLLRYILVDVMP